MRVMILLMVGLPVGTAAMATWAREAVLNFEGVRAAELDVPR